MKYYVMEISTGDNSIAGKAVYEYTDRDVALSSFHKKLGTAMGSDLYTSELISCINSVGGLEVPTEYWTNTFTVTFNANGGEGTMDSQTFTGEIAQKLSPNAYTYEGHTFIGWATSADATEIEYTDEESITVASDITLYAIWD